MTYIPGGGGGGSSNVAGLNDVALNNPLNNDSLVFDSGLGLWTNRAVTSQASALQSIQAVDSSRVWRWQNALAGAPSGVVVRRAGDDYWLIWKMKGNRWARITLAGVSGNGTDGPYGGIVHQINRFDVVQAAVNDGLTHAVSSGAGWTSTTSSGLTFSRTNTAGNTYTWTVPAGVNSAPGALSIVAHGTGGGIAVVSVNGSKTTAVGLQTMQELADGGYLDPAQLTTNGGSIDPTWRGYESYAASTTAETLPLGLAVSAGDTVIVEHSGGYRASVAGTPTSQRINLAGFSYASSAGDIAASAVFAVDTLGDRPSAWEVATSYEPDDLSFAKKFLGTYHGNDTESALTITVDGVSTSLADGLGATGQQSIVVTRTGTLTTAEAVTAANITVEYILTPEGLRIHPVVTWLKPGKVFAAYAMMTLKGPLNAGQTFTRGTTSASTASYATIPTTPGLDADYNVGKSASAVLISQNYAVLHTVLDYAQWASSPVATERTTVIEGRNLVGSQSTTSITKVYNTRYKGVAGETVSAGTVHEYTALIQAAYYVSGTSSAIPTDGDLGIA